MIEDHGFAECREGVFIKFFCNKKNSKKILLSP